MFNILKESNLTEEDLELCQSFANKLFIPCRKVTVSICEEVKCPLCEQASKKFTSRSPEESWRQLAGRQITFWICPKCKKILKLEEIMS